MEWEYKVVTSREIFRELPEFHDGKEATKILQNVLSQLGKAGWELAAKDGPDYIFKRRKK